MFAKTNLSEHFFYLLFQSLLIFHQLAVAALLYVLITKASCLVNLIIRVATLEEEHLAIALKGKDVRTDTVKEPTVVADHNSTAGKALKTLLQSTQGVDIDVVGRLVEQQHIALLLQSKSQLQAVTLTTRQGATELALVRAGKVEA